MGARRFITLLTILFTAAAAGSAEDRQAADAALKKGASLHFDFFYDGAKRLDLREESALLAEMLDAAYRKVGQELRFIPEDRVQVVLYDSEDFARDIRRDQWAGGLFDGKIRVPVGDFAKEKARLERVLLHEYVHAAVFRMFPDCPIWLNEGLAQLIEGSDSKAAEKRLRAAGRLVSVERMQGTFSGLSEEEARIAYDQSLVLTRRLVDAHSLYRVKEFLEGAGAEADGLEAEFQRRFFVKQGEFLSGFESEFSAAKKP